MADDPHALAYLQLLTDGIPQTVYDGQVPQDADGNLPDPPWALMYVNVHYRLQDRLPRHSRLAVARAYLHSVGGSASAARKVASAGRDVLLDVRPTITGRVCHRIVHEQSIPPARDEKLGPMFMDQVDVYRVDTEPA